MSINVMLVDDHQMLREGIKQLIEFDSQILVTSQASNGAECMNEMQKKVFDVVVLDINLPDISGLDLLRDLKREYKKTKILLLTVHNEIEYVVDAIDNGADGYILKDSGSGELIKAIKAVNDGDRYIQADLIPALNARLLKRDEESVKVKKITRREKEILICIALGKSNKEIASHCCISERTVKNHITSMFKKIGVNDRTQAAVYAIKNNYVRL